MPNAATKELLKEGVREIEKAKERQLVIRSIATRLGEQLTDDGPFPKSGKKKFTLSGYVVVLSHHPNAEPGKEWNLSIEEAEQAG